jgi:plastocyanin
MRGVPRRGPGRTRQWWLLFVVAPLVLTACAKTPTGPLAQEPTSLTTYSPGPHIASPLPAVRPSLTPSPQLAPTLGLQTFGTPTTSRQHSTQPTTHTTSPKPKPKPKPSKATGYVIYAYDFYFAPSDATVPVGATVRFANNSASQQHTWTSGTYLFPSGEFDSGQKSPGENDYTYTFNTAGTYNFYCQNHAVSNGMTGSITVE